MENIFKFLKLTTNYLLPNRYKFIGWIVLIPSLLLGIIYLIFQLEADFFSISVFAFFDNPLFHDPGFFKIIENNILDEIIAVLILIGAIFVAFSKEKHEDEYISKIRLESLVWATYFNYAVLLLALIFVYNLVFFWVLVFNIFTILFFFIIRFNWALKKSKKFPVDEK